MTFATPSVRSAGVAVTQARNRELLGPNADADLVTCRATGISVSGADRPSVGKLDLKDALSLRK